MGLLICSSQEQAMKEATKAKAPYTVIARVGSHWRVATLDGGLLAPELHELLGQTGDLSSTLKEALLVGTDLRVKKETHRGKKAIRAPRR